MDRSEESSYDARKEVDIVNEWLKNATQKFQSVFIWLYLIVMCVNLINLVSIF